MKKKLQPQTLVEVLLLQKDVENRGLTFISSGGHEDFLSYKELYNTALSWLGYLQGKGLRPGDELVLQIADNKSFICIFWASLLGAIIPVPVSVSYQGENTSKLFKILPFLKNPFLFTDHLLFDKLNSRGHSEEANDLRLFHQILFVEDIKNTSGTGSLHTVSPDSIAFLQFSSGSTGNPKGVVLQHSNLIDNIISATTAHELTESDSHLSWMPLTHDMGLIGFHLYPTWAGLNHYIMPTDLFIRRPLLWLQKVSEHRISVTCSPNFGFKYYLNQFSAEKGAGLNLSSIRILFNGAEPISASLMRDFNQTMGQFGLSGHAVKPVYGLAEATLQVTLPALGVAFKTLAVDRSALKIGSGIPVVSGRGKKNIKDQLEIVNVGGAIPGMEIKITDRQGYTLKSGLVGIIWIKGDSVTRQYYNNEAATKSVIKRDGWLNTGDTGFMHEGDLYAVGRVKDIIIVNGTNIYPHDIEQCVENMDGFEPGKVVACGIPDAKTDSESIVVFVLYKGGLESFPPIAISIKRLIAASMGLDIKQVVPVRKIYKTTSGKLKRYLFAEQYLKGEFDVPSLPSASPEKVSQSDMENRHTDTEIRHTDTEIRHTDTEIRHTDTKVSHTNTAIRQWLEQWLMDHIDLTKEDLAKDETFAAYGLTSLHAVELAAGLETYLQVQVEQTILFKYPTIRTLVAHFSESSSAREFGANFIQGPAGNTAGGKGLGPANWQHSDGNSATHDKNQISGPDERIAVIGFSCRFPMDINTPEAFWALLSTQGSTVTGVPENRWDADAWFDADENAAGRMYTRQGSFITNALDFDPLFFGISPREAAGMDPQHRLLLEVCWEALEQAGIKPSGLRGSDSGVFVGMGTDDYQHLVIQHGGPDYFEDAFTALGTERSIAAGRIAYLMDFHGPVMQLDTACSSSLLSVHQACQSLKLQECSLALAGGVNLILSPETTVKLCRMKALSASGQCRTFDDQADGYVRGEGAGMVVLKRLSDALAAGDNILAVINGSAVNHDGLSNGLTAPNGVAQQQLIKKALMSAGVAPGSIQYVEAHGTGTRLGDPVEVQALQAVYGHSRHEEDPLIIGAVKTNIGHLEAAAGIAGLIKIIVSLQRGQIPASLHYHTPNRFIPWKEMNIRVADRLLPWEPSDGRRRAAISAFGLSGTNVHLILEKTAEPAAGTSPDGALSAPLPSYPFLLSARTKPALLALTRQYLQLLDNGSVALPDLAYSSALTRETFSHRLAYEAVSVTELRKSLLEFSESEGKDALPVDTHGEQKLVWLFTGQGSQFGHMGLALYENNAAFKAVIDHCNDYLKTKWDISLVSLLYDVSKDESTVLLKQTKYTQPAIFAVSCALIAVWRSWGITPAVVAGHSVGEYAAAYAAGVFSLDDGLRLITERAALMQALEEPGVMAVVMAPADLVTTWIQPYGKDLSVAAINGPELTVISGKKKAVSSLCSRLRKTGTGSRELSVSHAFHSALMEPILDRFAEIAASLTYHQPQIQLVSNITGELAGSEIAGPAYWCKHIMQPVLFSASIHTIQKLGGQVLMELGPQPQLLSMARLTCPFDETNLLPSMRLERSSWSTIVGSALELHIKGIPVQWEHFFADSRYNRIQLPFYPFQRQHYGVEGLSEKTASPSTRIAIPSTKTSGLSSDAASLLTQAVSPSSEAASQLTPAVSPSSQVAGQLTQAVSPSSQVASLVDRTTGYDAVLHYITKSVSHLLKIPPAEINVHTPFLQIGADSLILATMVRKIEKEYGLSFSMRLLFEELTSPHRMAGYIAEHITPVMEPEQPVYEIAAVAQNAVITGPVQDHFQLMHQQFAILAQQFQWLSQQAGSNHTGGKDAGANHPANGSNGHTMTVTTVKSPIVPQNGKAPGAKKHASIFPKIEKKPGEALPPHQQAYLDKFISRYTERTKKSKEITRKFRPVLADNRVSAGFRFATKELVYPIVADSSSGSGLTDVDGNVYVDLTMGFGVNLLGHRPEIVTNAVLQQLQKGYQLGPQTAMAGEVAARIADLTGMDRVSFHNSGTEAVMSAIRLARTVTGRNKIAIFSGSYHGYFDSTLAMAEDIEADHQGVPITIGIIPNMVADVLVFDYQNPDVVKQIQAYAHELAAVLVEPVQSRRPAYQPVELLKELRAMTTAEKVILIFDEMITGFRIHPGGVQGHFGIQADLATYGKIVGGGMPIGIIAGRSWVMSGLDGGIWDYGDQSFPEADTTFFAGTFSKHPLSMAAAIAVLRELQEQGPALQGRLNDLTTRFVQRANALFEKNNVLIHLNHFGSLMYFSVTGNMDLFFYHVIEKGVYIWEGKTCFLSTAHTLADIDFVLRVFTEAIADLQAAGFLEPPTIPEAPMNTASLKTPVNGLTQTSLPPVTAVTLKPARIPLSYSQERLWFIDQLEGSIAYNEPAVYRINGLLDVAALEYSLQHIIGRHESLRTVIAAEDGQPYQRVLNKENWHIHITEAAIYKHKDETLKAAISSMLQKPFDLRNDYMIRAHLIRLSDTEHILVLTMHHIAFDGWSAEIIFRELIAGYQAFVNGMEPELPSLPVQFADYAIWQRSEKVNAILTNGLGYWKNKLKDITPLNLPVDFARPPVQTRKGKIVIYNFDQSLIRQIQKLGGGQGTTLFMTLLAAFKVLLYKYSGQEDICVGSPIAGRLREELEDLVGFFVNTLALRSNLSADMSFISFLAQVKQTILEAHEHQEIPFEKVVETVLRHREEDQSPLFRVLFVLQNTPDTPAFDLAPDIQLIPEPIDHQTTKFDIGFSVVEGADGYFASIEYCSDLFREATISNMFQHFEQLLRAILDNPTTPLGRLGILAEQERRLMLQDFNDTSLSYPSEKTITAIFEEQVVKTPDATALVFEDKEYSYATLDEAANRLAHFLLQNGIKEETRVPVCLDRCPELIIAILGILKAGGAYLPVDPSYPYERIAYMLQDSGGTVALTTAVCRTGIGSLVPGINWIDVESIPLDMPAYKPAAAIHARSLAYIIYTSGSTGRPKGVMVEHRNVVSLVKNVTYTTLNEADILLSTGSPSFDATTFEYWGMLLNGGCLVLCPEEVLLDITRLRHTIRHHHITQMWFTSSWLNQLVDTDITLFDGLKTILAGGEKLSDNHISRLKETYPSITIINGYGPTENTTFSLTYPITGIGFVQPIPIGRPLNNRTAYVLDGSYEPVPIGVTGELYVGGAGVSRGYLNRDDLTAERFITNPFSSIPGDRLYKTGDIVKWLPDGNIAYMGRADDQVKIRGFRIELGEIESVLRQCPLVSQATVIISTDRLIAYVVPSGEFDRTGMVDFLKLTLPEYMVPAVLVPMEKMPLTSNGKTDKMALPDPGDGILQGNTYAAPRNGTEQILTTIWQDLLSLPAVGINDNFFALGGHSLLAMRLMAALRKRFRFEGSVKTLFSYPTIAELAAHIPGAADIPGAANQTILPPIESYPRPLHIPLSYSQERLWFVDQLEGSTQYNLPAIFRLHGSLNEDALNRALQTIVNRHEVLRTTIREQDGIPYQHIMSQDLWQLLVVNDPVYYNNLPVVRSYIEQVMGAPFNLSSDFMLRAQLIVLEEHSYILLVEVHHIAADGWSMEIMVKELMTIYRAYVHGVPATLPDLPVQYADYAIWQRRYLSESALSGQLQFWKEKLEGVTVLNLPADFSRPVVQSSRGAIKWFGFDKALTEQLRQLSKQQDATLFMLLLAVYKVLLYRYSGQGDICVGSPIAGRTRQETEGLIGFFVNTLALRDDLTDNPAFDNLLAQVKLTILNAYDHQDISFEKVVDGVAKDRDPGRSPLFQTAFVLHNTPAIPDIRLDNIQFIAEDTLHTTSKLDLTFTLEESRDGGLAGNIEYCTDLFKESTITRLIGHFEQLLKSVIETPAARIGTLSMLNKVEQHTLLSTFNNTAVDPFFRSIKTVTDLFAAQVQSQPEATALIFGQESLTYRSLDERSNQLAHYLHNLGVGEEKLIPVCLERSLEMVIAIWGILKAGCTYVPIDPEYPAERISYLLSDTKADLVLSSSKGSTGLRESAAGLREADTGATVRIIEMDNSREIFERYPVTPLTTSPSPHHLAYVIYTSGSTGKPKGVMIEHRSVVNLALSQRNALRLQTGMRSLQFASLGFDASCYEIFNTLLSGGILVLPRQEDLLSADSFAAFVEEHQVEVVTLPPSYLKVIKEVLGPVKTIVSAGEALNVEDALYVRSRGVRLINAYGPTENTVCTSLTDEPLRDNGVVVIGRPIENIQVYILDLHGNLCPAGIPGEICVAGSGLARGYLHRPELTAEKFISHPFSDDASERVYRTGDLGRWHLDGEIEYLGRIDDQVKIRGYRIELGEIESVLLQSSQVREAVVLARADSSGNKRLIAYIVPEGEFDRQGILAHLGIRLPEYMIPSLWVPMEKFPLTPSGKVDKKALPDPDASLLLSGLYIAPRNPIEQTLATIWQDVLEVDRIGIHDNFFELGGHSLLVIRILSRIRKELGQELAIGDVFDNPSIYALGARLQGAAIKAVPGIVRKERPENIPLSYSQERLWFIHQMEGSRHYHIPAVFRLKGTLDQEALAAALRGIVNRHEVLRTVIVQKPGMTVQRVLDPNQWQWKVIDDRSFKKDPVALQSLIQELIYRPFDLSHDHMLRAELIVLGKEEYTEEEYADEEYSEEEYADEEYILVITMHHIAADGGSTGIIVQELLEGFNAAVEGRAAGLTTPEIQYADYAIWQQQNLTPAVISQKLNYWKQQLSNVVPLQLPTDQPRPAIQSTRGAQLKLDIDPVLTQQLQQLSRQQEVTLFMTLLAAFNVLLYRYSGQVNICVGTPISGRSHQETNGLIGFFLNTLALSFDLGNNPTFTGLLQQVKETTIQAYDHQDLPFEKVVEAVVTDRDQSRSPLFQTMFMLQNMQAIPELKLGDIVMAPEQFEYSTSKFDLVFSLEETTAGLNGYVEFCTDLFNTSTIGQMKGHYENLLRAVVATPDERIGTLPLLTGAEQHQLLSVFNDTGVFNDASGLRVPTVDDSKNKTLIDLFNAQATAAPDRIALAYNEQSLTYRELDRSSNQLAHYLRRMGVGEETLVPVCLERSTDIVIAMVAIIKAGGAYVPIDPAYPADRIDFMLEDCGARVIISHADYQTLIPGTPDRRVIMLDKDWPLIREEKDTAINYAISEKQLAYMIYTSGSTGKPKGVMIEQKGVMNLVNWHISVYQVYPDSRASAMAGIGFDAFGWEVWPYLCAGAAVYLFDDETRLSVKDLLHQFAVCEISHSFVATAIASAFIRESRHHKLPLQFLLTGGDQLPATDITGLTYQVINNYGPTEYSVVSTFYPLADQDRSRIPLIGRPIHNTQIFILNDQDALCPVGVYGEICITGAGLARGYWNRPDLTEEKFLSIPSHLIVSSPSHLTMSSPSRMYRSGDTGRWLADGRIEFRGRTDSQVKIRGFRIELGEIEQVLLQSDGVRQAVVVVSQPTGEHNSVLVAYLVSDGNFDRQQTLSYLKGKLPGYMVPVLLVEMAALPLTPNGKIDKAALPAPDFSSIQSNVYIAPRNKTEQSLAELCQQILGIERISVQDNLFDLGMHSLQIMRLSAAVNESLNIQIAVGTFFQLLTIEALANYIIVNRQRQTPFPEKRKTITL